MRGKYSRRYHLTTPAKIVTQTSRHLLPTNDDVVYVVDKVEGSKIGLRPLGDLLLSPKDSLSSDVPWPLHAEFKNSSKALSTKSEPGLAELPLIADAMVAAGLPHGAGLVVMARIEDTSISELTLTAHPTSSLPHHLLLAAAGGLVALWSQRSCRLPAASTRPWS